MIIFLISVTYYMWNRIRTKQKHHLYHEKKLNVQTFEIEPRTCFEKS